MAGICYASPPEPLKRPAAERPEAELQPDAAKTTEDLTEGLSK
jgi:hypothetical protein